MRERRKFGIGYSSHSLHVADGVESGVGKRLRAFFAGLRSAQSVPTGETDDQSR